MGDRKRRAVPVRLVRARKRFADWRRTRHVGTRIPKSLWVLAVRLADTYGVNQTANILRLDYYTLKKRVDAKASESPPVCTSASTPAFVELASPVLAAPGECVVDFKDAAGDRMRVHLKGGDLPDLIALGRSFWSIER